MDKDKISLNGFFILHKVIFMPIMTFVIIKEEMFNYKFKRKKLPNMAS